MEIKPKYEIALPKFIEIPENIKGYEAKIRYINAHADEQRPDDDEKLSWKNQHLKFVESYITVIHEICLCRVLNDAHPDKIDDMSNDELLKKINECFSDDKLDQLKTSIETIFTDNWSFVPMYNDCAKDYLEYKMGKKEFGER